MGFQVVMFIDSFMDDVTYIRDVEVCMCSMICYIPGCICCGSENFGLGSLCDDYGCIHTNSQVKSNPVHLDSRVTGGAH
jgi:hypothetical protein